MSNIKGQNTKPEILVRKALFAKGYRYRIHQKHLPGKPDIVFNKFKSVIFVHGCFWHAHDCHVFKVPKSNTEFWKDKLSGNIYRDYKHKSSLLDLGWRVLTVWECALRGKFQIGLEHTIDRIEFFLKSDFKEMEIANRNKMF